MIRLTAKEAQDGFGRLIDLARVAPVIVAKHGQWVLVVEEFKRLKRPEADQMKSEEH